MNHFTAAATSGSMPGGEQTSQPLFPNEYMRYFAQKYVDWAPRPWSELPAPGTDMGPLMGSFNIPGDSPPPALRIMHSLGEMDRIFEMAMSLHSATMGLSLKAMKSRVSQLMYLTSTEHSLKVYLLVAMVDLVWSRSRT